MKQLDSNLAASDLPLSADHIERLDKLSESTLNFPAQVMKIAPNFSNAGATVNGSNQRSCHKLQRTSRFIISFRLINGAFRWLVELVRRLCDHHVNWHGQPKFGEYRCSSNQELK